MAYLSPQIGPLSASQPGSSRRTGKLPGFLGKLNWPFLLNVLLLVAFGLVVVYSAVSHDSETYHFSRQLATVAVGVVAMLVVWHFDYRRLEHMMVILLIINVVLILSPHLPLIGVESKGAQSWINIGIQFQPGEFAKVTVLLLAASVVAKVERDALMVKLAREYPQYGWEQCKGYASAAHIQAIREYGLSPLHRVSFCQSFLQETLF